MQCNCKRCGSASSVFWWPFAIGASAQSVVEEDQVFYLCDRCVHDFTRFMDGYVVSAMTRFVPTDPVSKEGSE